MYPYNSILNLARWTKLKFYYFHFYFFDFDNGSWNSITIHDKQVEVVDSYDFRMISLAYHHACGLSWANAIIGKLKKSQISACTYKRTKTYLSFSGNVTRECLRKQRSNFVPTIITLQRIFSAHYGNLYKEPIELLFCHTIWPFTLGSLVTVSIFLCFC